MSNENLIIKIITVVHVACKERGGAQLKFLERAKNEYLDRGADGLEVAAVLIKRHVLEPAASVGQAGVVRPEEHRRRHRRRISGGGAHDAVEGAVHGRQGPPRVVPAVSPQQHVSLPKNDDKNIIK